MVFLILFGFFILFNRLPAQEILLSDDTGSESFLTSRLNSPSSLSIN